MHICMHVYKKIKIKYNVKSPPAVYNRLSFSFWANPRIRDAYILFSINTNILYDASLCEILKNKNIYDFFYTNNLFSPKYSSVLTETSPGLSLISKWKFIAFVKNSAKLPSFR